MADDFIKIPLSDSEFLAKASGWSKSPFYYKERVKARHRGLDYYLMSKSDYDEALAVIEENNRKNHRAL